MTEPTTEPRARSSYDPFAPPAPEFPRVRLLRAGVEDVFVSNLNEQWQEQMSPRQRRELASFVTRSSDSRIRERFTEPDGDPDAVRTELMGKGNAELKDLLRAQGKPLGGRHDELVARLLEDDTEQDGDEDTGDAVVGSPVEDGGDGEQAEVEVTHADGSVETITGELPLSATQTPGADTGDGQTTTEEQQR